MEYFVIPEGAGSSSSSPPTLIPTVIGFGSDSFYYTGNGTIEGIVRIKKKNSAQCECVLFTEKHNQFVQSVLSDENGIFKFNNVDETFQYYIVAREKSGLWEYRIQSKITPVV